MYRLPVKYYKISDKKFLKEYKLMSRSPLFCLFKDSYWTQDAESWSLLSAHTRLTSQSLPRYIEFSEEPSTDGDWVWAKLEMVGYDMLIMPADGPSDREFALTLREN